ncbi:unnamed protein product [Vicia faba]|uniref:RNase H type-1 domain-containing protein n=1 Tax=Vicia faba TaxID=3906 RepID=A0AAV1B3N3_VICFA|nr:unnamed protein product [Vicia faba]
MAFYKTLLLTFLIIFIASDIVVGEIESDQKLCFASNFCPTTPERCDQFCFAWDPRILSVIEAEALALKDAILRAMSSHLELVTFERDSQ